MLLQLEINLANRCSGSPVGIESFQFVHALVLKAQLSGLMGLPLKHPPFSRSLGESTFQSFGDCTALSMNAAVDGAAGEISKLTPFSSVHAHPCRAGPAGGE